MPTTTDEAMAAEPVPDGVPEGVDPFDLECRTVVEDLVRSLVARDRIRRLSPFQSGLRFPPRRW
jgi:hypothetical protein